MTAPAAAPPTGSDPLDLRLAAPALATWVVAWQGRLLPPPVLLSAAAVLLVAGAVLLLRSPRGRPAVVAAVCVCAAAAGLVTGLHAGSRATGPLAQLAADEAAVAVEAVLTDDPRRALTTAGAGPGRAELVVVRLRVEVLEARGRTYRLRAPVVLLAAEPAWLPLLPSQRVRVEGRLRPAERGDDVAAVLSGRGPPDVLTGPSTVQRAAGHLRAGLRAAVEPLPDAEQGLLPGLVVGDVSRLDPQLREDFRTTGLTHLTAVSGTNCSIVVGAVLLLSRRLRLGLLASPALAALALVGFVVLARPSPSVLRAAVMGVIGLLALATGSRKAALPALSAAVILLVLVDPDLAATPGFALSVLATGGLLLLAPTWRASLARRMPGWLADAIAVPAAAQAACGPVVVAISSTLGPLTVPANLLAVPAVAPATIIGVGAALLAPVSMPLAQGLAWLGYLPTAWLVLVARVGAGLPGAELPWPDGSAGAVLMAAVTVGVLVALPRRRLRGALAAGTAGAVVAAGALVAVRPAWPPPGWFLVACDVGQGDAVVLNAGRGSAVLVDAGPDPKALDACLRRLDVGRLPLVLLTHLHEDHIAGLPGALGGRAVGAVQVGPVADAREQHARVETWVEQAGVSLSNPALGEQRTAGALRWTVLAPGRAYRGTRSDPNNSSLVLRLVVGRTTVLLTGDIEPEAQRDLLRSGVDLRSDVLKVPHHGSAHQDPEFLDAVGARVVLTSLGEGNDYGHPSGATLQRLQSRGARSLRTDLDGDLALAHRGEQLVAVGREGVGTVAARADMGR